MGFEDFEPIFGQAKAEWQTAGSAQLSSPYLFHVYAPDPSHLKFRATDFRTHTWEADRSIHQLEDMRDYIGIGGSWSEFMDYVITSLKSGDVKLVLKGEPKSTGASSAKLVAQKSKGMPRISFSLSKLLDSAAGVAMANLSIELFGAFKETQNSLIREQQRCCQQKMMISAEQEKSQSIKSQLDAILYPKKQKLPKTSSERRMMSTNSDTSSIAAMPKSAEELVGAEVQTKVPNHVIPAKRRPKVRGAVLRDADDD